MPVIHNVIGNLLQMTIILSMQCASTTNSDFWKDGVICNKKMVIKCNYCSKKQQIIVQQKMW